MPTAHHRHLLDRIEAQALGIVSELNEIADHTSTTARGFRIKLKNLRQLAEEIGRVPFVQARAT